MDSSPSPAPSIPIPPSPPRDLDKPRRNLVTPTNSLILLLPQNLFSPSFLPLLQAHFASYGPVAAWTPLERLGRVLVVYQDVDSSVAARREMDGFVWEEDEDDPVHPYPAAGSLPLSSEDPHSATADSQRCVFHRQENFLFESTYLLTFLSRVSPFNHNHVQSVGTSSAESILWTFVIPSTRLSPLYTTLRPSSLPQLPHFSSWFSSDRLGTNS